MNELAGDLLPTANGESRIGRNPALEQQTRSYVNVRQDPPYADNNDYEATGKIDQREADSVVEFYRSDQYAAT